MEFYPQNNENNDDNNVNDSDDGHSNDDNKCLVSVQQSDITHTFIHRINKSFLVVSKLQIKTILLSPHPVSLLSFSKRAEKYAYVFCYETFFIVKLLLCPVYPIFATISLGMRIITVTVNVSLLVFFSPCTSLPIFFTVSFLVLCFYLEKGNHEN